MFCKVTQPERKMVAHYCITEDTPEKMTITKESVEVACSSLYNPPTTAKALKSRRKGRQASEWNARMQIMGVQDVADELFQEVLKCMDARTRLRLQRVCRYWKFCVFLPIVNAVIHLDLVCFPVLRGRGIYTVVDKSDKIWKSCLWDHARLVIFDGEDSVQWSYAVATAGLTGIGVRMPKLREIHVRRMVFHGLLSLFPGMMPNLFTLDYLLKLMSANICAGNMLDKMTCSASQYSFQVSRPALRVSYWQWSVKLPAFRMHLSRVKKTENESIKQILCIALFTGPNGHPQFRTGIDGLLWPYSVRQIQWVALHAPKLPLSYYSQSLGQLENFFKLSDDGGSRAVPPLLGNFDFSATNREVLLILARCIEDYRTSRDAGFCPPPPEPFPLDFTRDEDKPSRLGGWLVWWMSRLPMNQLKVILAAFLLYFVYRVFFG